MLAVPKLVLTSICTQCNYDQKKIGLRGNYRIIRKKSFISPLEASDGVQFGKF